MKLLLILKTDEVSKTLVEKLDVATFYVDFVQPLAQFYNHMYIPPLVNPAVDKEWEIKWFNAK